jgi:hypothetical protein
VNFFLPKNDQNLSFLKHHIFVLNSLVRGLHTFGSISGSILYDLGISRIEKILLKLCPKFFDSYASIYGRSDDNPIVNSHQVFETNRYIEPTKLIVNNSSKMVSFGILLLF